MMSRSIDDVVLIIALLIRVMWQDALRQSEDSVESTIGKWRTLLSPARVYRYQVQYQYGYRYPGTGSLPVHQVLVLYEVLVCGRLIPYSKHTTRSSGSKNTMVVCSTTISTISTISTYLHQYGTIHVLLY